MIYMPDTNAWSRYLRGRREDRVLLDRLEQHVGELVLSAIALMELEYGAAKRPDVPAFRTRVERLRENFSVAAFAEDAAFHTGAVRAQLATHRPQAQPIGPFDNLLAGHAIALNAVFVTHNTGEFRRVAGLRVEDWQLEP